MTIKWSFSTNSFVKFHGKKFGNHNIAVLYPNLCYTKVLYKGAGLSHPFWEIGPGPMELGKLVLTKMGNLTSSLCMTFPLLD